MPGLSVSLFSEPTHRSEDQIMFILPGNDGSIHIYQEYQHQNCWKFQEVTSLGIFPEFSLIDNKYDEIDVP